MQLFYVNISETKILFKFDLIVFLCIKTFFGLEKLVRLTQME